MSRCSVQRSVILIPSYSDLNPQLDELTQSAPHQSQTIKRDRQEHQTQREKMGDQPMDKARPSHATTKASADTTSDTYDTSIERLDPNDPSATRTPEPLQTSARPKKTNGEQSRSAAPKRSPSLYFYPNPDTFTFEDPVRYLSPPGSPAPSPVSVARTQPRTACCICSRCGHVNETDKRNDGSLRYPRPFSLKGRYH